MKSKIRIQFGKIVILSALVLVVGGIVWYVIRDVRESKARIAASQMRYLKAKAFVENAREQAKEEARREVAEHGKKSTPEMKRKANSIISRKAGRLKGPKAFFAAARLLRGRENARRNVKAPDPMPVSEFNAEELEIMEAADAAVSDHDLETASDLAAEALKSKDPRVRLRAVETLTQFGEAGLPEMADFLKDPHPDVANLAADRFELATQEVENESERVAIAKLGMLSISDEDQLRSMGSTLIMASDARVIVQALADVIRDGSEVQRAAAKEAYQNQTGEEWQGEKAADKWLQENYTPPEPEEAEDVNESQKGENT